MKEIYLAAMRADAVPECESGLWFVRKLTLCQMTTVMHEGEYIDTPAGVYTYLRRYTDSTLLSGGEVVMEDTPHELLTHLNFVMQAYGKVLITGLGLGCVIRGLLANPNVECVTCIENSKDVLKLVAPHMPMSRLTIVEADALQWAQSNKELFDCAWHDVWTNRDDGEPHLDIWHERLLFYCRSKVKRQGAWAFNRDIKALICRRKLIQWMG